MHGSGRRIELDTCFNFRDMGGYPTPGGGRVRWHTLYRSDTLHRLEGDALEHFAGLGLRSVVDLRHDHERDRHGRFPDAGLPIIVHEVALVDDAGEGTTDAAPMPATTGEAYIGMAQRGHRRIARAVSLLGQPGALPAVFHCTAGKDRTGVVAALVLRVLGVGDDDIVADYLLTGRSAKARYEWLETADPAYHAFLMSLPEHIRNIDPEAIPTLLGWVDREFGGAEQFLVAGGTDPADLDRLRAELVEAQ